MHKNHFKIMQPKHLLIGLDYLDSLSDAWIRNQRRLQPRKIKMRNFLRACTVYPRTANVFITVRIWMELHRKLQKKTSPRRHYSARQRAGAVSMEVNSSN